MSKSLKATIIQSHSQAASQAIAIRPVDRKGLERWLRRAPKKARAWVKSNAFSADAGSVLAIPGEGGGISEILWGRGTNAEDRDTDIWAYAALPAKLPAGRYRLSGRLNRQSATNAALGWTLEQYSFDRYRAEPGSSPDRQLVLPAGINCRKVDILVEAIHLTRDLINTPAEDMGPQDLAAATRKVGRRFDARVTVVRGKVLEAGFPAIHAVGRAARTPPLLIDLRWGRAGDPKVTLVGKGVCFDSGGLDLKSATGMRLMKKDMGGGANALGLAFAVMAAKLRVRLRLLIPAVENAVAGNAYRPGDVINTRKGLTVEIGNTDAEGRLVLADALTLADEEKPELLLDFATLTGAAKVALGGDLPALYSNDDKLADSLATCGGRVSDPVWHMPLWQPYMESLKSRVADISNISEGGFAGSITAALFLSRFVDNATPWAHLDIFAWNAKDRPGRPYGGEASGLRAAFALLEDRYGAKS